MTATTSLKEGKAKDLQTLVAWHMLEPDLREGSGSGIDESMPLQDRKIMDKVMDVLRTLQDALRKDGGALVSGRRPRAALAPNWLPESPEVLFGYEEPTSEQTRTLNKATAKWFGQSPAELSRGDENPRQALAKRQRRAAPLFSVAAMGRGSSVSREALLSHQIGVLQEVGGDPDLFTEFCWNKSYGGRQLS